MDLFYYMRSNTMENEAPLASRIRPKTLEEVVDSSTLSEKTSCFIVPLRQIS